MSETSRGTALVTGATRNIGRRIALDLAEDGYNVLMIARNENTAAEEVQEGIAERGSRSLMRAADVRDHEAVTAAVEQAREELGPVQVLVNNAALRRESDFLDIDRPQWNEVLDIILGGAFTCAQAVLPHMLETGSGRIINIAGVAGQTGAAKRAHVVTAKAGIVGLTKALAHEYAASGITVNAVSPGLIATERDEIPEHHRTARIPVGRTGDVAEVSAAVRYLAGPESAFMTGQTLSLNGGIHMP